MGDMENKRGTKRKVPKVNTSTAHRSTSKNRMIAGENPVVNTVSPTRNSRHPISIALASPRMTDRRFFDSRIITVAPVMCPMIPFLAKLAHCSSAPYSIFCQAIQANNGCHQNR
jgi:hypothetical protein